MVIYEARGFSSLLYPYKGNLTPFEYIAQFKPMNPPENMTIDDFKEKQAPYCISGKVKAEKSGSYKRSNENLLYRDLIFIDYDDISISAETFKDTVHSVLSNYSYILYPTIKHTAKKPRYRLVVKPDKNLTELDYKETVNHLADLIGLPYDQTSETWSQLQGLPVTTGEPKEYQKIVHRGLDFPVPIETYAPRKRVTTTYTPRFGDQRSITMKVIDTLFDGFGAEGGRNVAVTRFVGLLIGKWVNCDIPTAWELTKVANSVTAEPLPVDELEATFESIVKTEIRKRGLGISN
ncbi:primase alpha helix C-terminal domain-containing protein [Streptococcus parasuis]|uniref:primase alpha helix C-terminal domain-containing protein n=1 Tax=Streptococcus parasuis TaxID=1501662 RepID=UPI002FE1DAC8